MGLGDEVASIVVDVDSFVVGFTVDGCLVDVNESVGFSVGFKDVGFVTVGVTLGLLVVGFSVGFDEVGDDVGFVTVGVTLGLLVCDEGEASKE